MQNFRSLQLAIEFYRLAKEENAPYYLKNQLERAASSVALNLSEGSAKRSSKDRRRFYEIALGSVRECETIVHLLGTRGKRLSVPVDVLARHGYKLTRSL